MSLKEDGSKHLLKESPRQPNIISRVCINEHQVERRQGGAENVKGGKAGSIVATLL